MAIIYISTPEKKPGLGSQKSNRLNSGYGPGTYARPVHSRNLSHYCFGTPNFFFSGVVLIYIYPRAYHNIIYRLIPRDWHWAWGVGTRNAYLVSVVKRSDEENKFK